MSRKYCNVKFHPENRVPGDITIVPPRGKRVKIPELTKQTLHVTVRGCWSLLLKTLVNVRALQGQKAPGSDTLLPPHQKLLVTIGLDGRAGQIAPIITIMTLKAIACRIKGTWQ